MSVSEFISVLIVLELDELEDDLDDFEFDFDELFIDEVILSVEVLFFDDVVFLEEVVDTINSLPEHNKFLRGLFSWVGYKQIPFQYERKERFAGKTKYPLKKMLKLASDGIISFSTKPLKIVGGLGIISIVISFILLIYALISYIFKLNNLSAGWTSLMLGITFFAGVQLLSLWIMSEYIARIYDESKNRPQYIIEKKINIEK